LQNLPAQHASAGENAGMPVKAAIRRLWSITRIFNLGLAADPATLRVGDRALLPAGDRRMFWGEGVARLVQDLLQGRDGAMIGAGAFQSRAVETGLTGPLVRDIVLRFYAKARRDAVLGPLFETAIGADWDAHIERIVSFWLTATRLERSYDGGEFMRAHLKHRSIRVDHIPRWLALFDATLAASCSTAQADALRDIAVRMAENIELGLARRDR
jgi:hemoglobin